MERVPNTSTLPLPHTLILADSFVYLLESYFVSISSQLILGDTQLFHSSVYITIIVGEAPRHHS